MILYEDSDIDDDRPWSFYVSQFWKAGVDEIKWNMSRKDMAELNYVGRLKVMDNQSDTNLFQHRDKYPAFMVDYETISTRQRRLDRDYMINYSYDHIKLREIYNGICRTPSR